MSAFARTPSERESVEAAAAALPLLPLREIGRILEVHFPVANTRRDVPHGLSRVPDGYFLILESEGLVRAVDVTTWTRDVAWLSASANNTRARLVFYTLQEGALINVVP